MAEMTLVIGSDVRCSDGFRADLIGVVLDPAAGTVTHLAVEPKGRAGLARLVPMDLVAATTAGRIELCCDQAEFTELSPAEETLAEFVPGYDDPVQLLAPGWQSAGGPAVEGDLLPRTPELETVPIVPPGEVEERRGDHVHATDGDIGRLRGLRVDADRRQVTHLLISEGHLLTRKLAEIPFGQVTGLDDGIRLSITKQQVRDLPRADVDQDDGSP